MTPERRLVTVAALALVVLGLAVMLMLGVAGSVTRDGGPSRTGASGEAPVYDLSIVRLENEHVLALENHYPPGVESALHAHDAPRIVYVLEGGSLRLVDEAGTEEEVHLEAGATVWRPAETHVVRNVGATPVRVLEIEVRSARVPD